MKTSVVSILALSGAATAFAPNKGPLQSTSQLNAVDVRKELGAIPPFGFFDPLGFIENGPYGDARDNFEHYRGVEVKHGRIAMAATVGMLAQQTSSLAGYISPSKDLKFADIPNGLGALKAVPIEGWVQMVVVIGMHEILIKQREGKPPGDFGTGYFGFPVEEGSEKQKAGLNAEISNGRLAMLGILGMFASEIVHGGEVLAEVKDLA
eukprot:CAMPEP_0194360992 /NCGR_PEP_ID=MMETSP0174-20130528/8474_1 /TAXON_ID=216777 /ORGANISM="Proboscia alata, Strain PI-D3" /LENGTH=207 /DNA_ID=CAMNT_0039132875 /DNA_START=65 /DNA_END=688 /DNA_ORIENTATION=-